MERVMDNTDETDICPDCGAIRFNYCGMQVCQDCYHRAVEEMEREEYEKDQLRRREIEEDNLRWARENK